MLALVSLAVHELSHAFMAARLGLVVSSIEVQPFGFIAELHTPPRTPSECLSVAAAGPFASLLIALCGAGLGKYIGHTSAAFQDFCSFNLSLGLMNLLPFLPLDGGRLALALIEKRIGRARAQRTLSLFGIIFGVLLFCAGVLLVSATDAAFNPTPLAAGFFIFISAIPLFLRQQYQSKSCGFITAPFRFRGSRCADSTAKRLHGAKSTFVYRGQGIRHHFCC